MVVIGAGNLSIVISYEPEAHNLREVYSVIRQRTRKIASMPRKRIKGEVLISSNSIFFQPMSS